MIRLTAIAVSKIQAQQDAEQARLDFENDYEIVEIDDAYYQAEFF